MEIISYIESLLADHPQVGLTEFGTFFKIKIPGRFDSDNQTYLPPSYTLNFTKEVKENELLANYISSKRNITIESANYFINEFVTKKNIEFNTDQKIELGNLGFFKNKKFTANPNLNLGTDFFGLPSLKEFITDNHPVAAMEADDLPPLEDKLEEPAFSKQFVNESPIASNEENIKVFEQIQTPNNLIEPSSNNPLNKEIFEEETRNSTNYLKWLIPIILLIICAVLFFIYRNAAFNNSGSSDISESTDLVLIPADTLSTDSALKVNIKTSLRDSTVLKKDSLTFEIIATAVKEKDVENMIHLYTKVGYKPKVFPGRYLNKISVASFTTEKEARDSLPSVQIKLKNKEIYIFQNKP